MASMDPFNNTYTKITAIKPKHQPMTILHGNVSPGVEPIYSNTYVPKLRRIGDLIVDIATGKAIPIRKIK